MLLASFHGNGREHPLLVVVHALAVDLLYNQTAQFVDSGLEHCFAGLRLTDADAGQVEDRRSELGRACGLARIEPRNYQLMGGPSCRGSMIAMLFGMDGYEGNLASWHVGRRRFNGPVGEVHGYLCYGEGWLWLLRRTAAIATGERDAGDRQQTEGDSSFEQHLRSTTTCSTCRVGAVSQERYQTRLGDLEEAVVETLWEQGVLTTPAVFDLVGRPRGLAYTTILTVLQRLTKKGIVTRHEQGKAHSYEAALTREEYNRKRAHTLAAEIVPLGAAGMAAFLAEAERLDPAIVARLRESMEAEG